MHLSSPVCVFTIAINEARELLWEERLLAICGACLDENVSESLVFSNFHFIPQCRKCLKAEKRKEKGKGRKKNRSISAETKSEKSFI